MFITLNFSNGRSATRYIADPNYTIVGRWARFEMLFHGGYYADVINSVTKEYMYSVYL